MPSVMEKSLSHTHTQTHVNASNQTAVAPLLPLMRDTHSGNGYILPLTPLRADQRRVMHLRGPTGGTPNGRTITGRIGDTARLQRDEVH